MRPKLRAAIVSSLGLLGLATVSSLADDDAEAKAKVNYKDHVAGIFQSRCNSCHNADAQKGGLNLETFSSLMQGGGSGEVIEPGDPDNSWLYLLVSHEEEPQMPPNSPRIPDEELATIRAWIELGAPETSGSVVAMPKKNKLEFQLDPDALGKPSGDPALPQGVPTEPQVVSERPNPIIAMAASPWAPLVAIGGHKQVLLYHTDDQRLLAVFPFPEGTIHSLKFTTDGDLLLAGGGRGGQSGRVVVWDVKTGARFFEAGREYDVVLGADISPDRSLIALGGPGKVLRVYRTEDEELAYEQRAHTDWVTAVSFSPDGVLLASGDRNGGLFVWEAYTGREFADLRNHTELITDLSWRLDSNVLASSSEDASVRLWDMNNDGNQIRNWNAHGGGTQSVRFAKDARLVTSGRDRTVKLWAADGKEIQAFDAFPDLALQAALTHDDAKIVAGDWSGAVRIFPTDASEPIGELLANPLPVAQRLERIEADHTHAQAEAEAALQELEPFQFAVANTTEALELAQQALAEGKETATAANEATSEAEAVLAEAREQHQSALDALQSATEADAQAIAALSKATQRVAEHANAVRSTSAQSPSDPKAIEAAEADRAAATQAMVPALAKVIESAEALKASRPPLAEAKTALANAEQAFVEAKAVSDKANAKFSEFQTAVEQANDALEAAEAALAERKPAVDALVAKASALKSELDALNAELAGTLAQADPEDSTGGEE